MVFGVAELLVLVVLIALGGWVAWRAFGSSAPRVGDERRLPARDRVWVAQAIARAQWMPAHDELAGDTRILIRRTYTGLDGHPAVLEERVLESFSSQDVAWEARFTEGMSRARLRCSYLNTEEAAG